MNFKLIILFLSLITNQLFGQIHMNDFYEDKHQQLIYSKTDTTSLSLQQFRVWTIYNLENSYLEEESKTMLVYSLKTNSFKMYEDWGTLNLGWNIKLYVEFKDKVMKLSFVDGGNLFWKETNAFESTYKFYNFFDKKGFCQTPYCSGLQSIKNYCIKTADLITRN